MTINLIVQYYKCGNEARQKEIDICLATNLNNEFISSIHLLTEQLHDLSQFPHQEKIKQTVVGERLTFERAFQHANQHHANRIWILSNADIYFDESLSCLEDAKLDEAVFALTRHDVQADSTSEIVEAAYAHGCQDAWIFKVPIHLNQFSAQFYLGIPGCDNRIAYDFINAGYKVINPSKKIFAYHLDLARGKNVAERVREYAKLTTNEGVDYEYAVPPPYQYCLYPVDQVDPDSFEMYRFYLARLAEVEKLEQYKNLYDSILKSKSWRITKPLRAVSELIRRVKVRQD